MYVKTFTALQSPAAATPIYCNRYTTSVVVCEDQGVNGWPTTGFAVWTWDTNTGTFTGPINFTVGQKFEFASRDGTRFQQGQLLGQIQPTTTTTIAQQEYAAGGQVGNAQ